MHRTGKWVMGAAVLILLASWAFAGDDDRFVGERTEPRVVKSGESGTDCEFSRENYGDKFLGVYCYECHHSDKSGMMQRKGAPTGMDWDDDDTVAKYAKDMVERVAEIKDMPPWFGASPKPTEEERANFQAWIECAFEK